MELTAAQRIRKQTREATRRVLLEAGLAETVSRGGLEVPSIDAICARAGYTRGAFYVHFRDRDQFEAEMFEWVVNDILRSLWANAVEGATDVRDVVRRFTDTLAQRNWPDLHGDIRAGYLAVLRAITAAGSEVKDRHAKLMHDIIGALELGVRAGQEDGTLRKDIDPHKTGTILLLSAIAGIVWDEIGIELDVRALGESLIGLIETPGENPRD